MEHAGPAPPPSAADPRAPRHARLLAVVHDGARRNGLAQYLRLQGYEVLALAAAEGLQQALLAQPPALLFMDVGLPGPQTCQALRAARCDVPIILLATCGDEAERVLGLELGADDCLARPYSARELLARIRAVLRRTREAQPEGLSPGPLRIGHWVFNPAERQLHSATRSVPLNAMHFALLSAFAAQPGRALSRRQLAGAWRGGSAGSGPLRAVDTAVMRLRRLVEPNPAEPRHILTVRGQGYVLVPSRGGGSAEGASPDRQGTVENPLQPGS